MSLGKEMTFTGSEGTHLQGYAFIKHRTDRERLGLVIFHPYAHLGGCCNDPIVLSMFRQAVQTAAVHAVVRYNQRGVGSSSGFKSFWGSQDMADAVSVCQQILAWKDGPTHLHVIGYSWGACLAAHAAQLADVSAFVGVSPVTGGFASFFLRTRRHLLQLSIRPGLPKMLILGDHDQFSSLSSLRKVFKMQQHESKRVDLASQADHPMTADQTDEADMSNVAHVTVMAGCDHFFIHHRRQLAEQVMQFCLEHQEVKQSVQCPSSLRG